MSERAPNMSGWTDEAHERHERLFDALRFRRMARKDLEGCGFDWTRTLNDWIKFGDRPHPRSLKTIDVAQAIGVEPKYLSLGGPWLWKAAPGRP